MTAEHITSRQNPLIVRLRKLGSDRALRRQEGVFLCDGVKLVGEAVRWGAAVETVVLAEGTDLPHALPATARVVTVPGDLLQSIATVESPQGVLAVCHTPPLALPDTLPVGRLLVLDGVQDPGNVGTIWRTADALGAAGLVLLPGCADPFAPKTVRATMGACFRLPVWECSLQALKSRLDAAGVPLWATALRADSEDVRRADLRHAAVVIGSEGRGVSDEVLARCDKTIQIPMEARCESLNAAVAASIVLWEGARE